MRTKYKFILLTIIACLASIYIYNTVDRVNPVKYVSTLTEEQVTIDQELLNDTNYTFENPKIILNPYKISPLSALIIFETKDYTSPTITIKGKDDKTTITNTFKANTIHYIPVYGLYPDTNNEVILNVNGVEKTLYIKTDKLPEDFILPTSVVADKNELDNDLYFMSPSSKGYTAAYDINGDVRWYLNIKVTWDIERLDNGHLLLSTNRLINVPYYNTGLYEMDLLGKIYFEYSLEGGYHHDVVELPNNNLLVASDKFEHETVEDYIVEIDRNTGKIVKEIDLKEILPVDQGTNYDYSVEYDWFHNNSVWYDEATDSITLSGRHQDIVINIDYSTLQINYIIGDPTNWKEDYLKYFLTPIGSTEFEWQYAQHAAMILPNGDVFVFDNGNNKTKTGENAVPANESYSRGVIYRVDKNNMTIEQIWQYGKELGSKFYSPYISDVDYIENNHYIVHSGGHSELKGNTLNTPAGLGNVDKLTSTTIEIKNNREIFNLVLPTNIYRTEKLSAYANDVFYPTSSIRLGDMGETKTDDNVSIFFKTTDLKDLEKYDIQITKEIDRLVVTGTFDKSDNVDIILDNVFSKNTYHMIISKKPYTSMCVDLYNEESTEGIKVTKYITDKGLSGKKYIYLKINGKVYDLNEYIIY